METADPPLPDARGMRSPPWSTPTVFFDLDGCLVDSRAAITASINDALVAVGLPRQPDTDLYKFIGPPLHGTFAELLAGLGGDTGEVEVCVLAYRESYRHASVAHTVAVPGIAELLGRLASRARLAVVTSKPQAFAAPILASVGLERWFFEVFAPSLQAVDEPKAVTLERALRWARFPVDPSRRRAAWMVGDRRHDVEAGRRCGTSTMAVTWGIGDRRELTEAGPTALVDRPSEVVRVLDGSRATPTG